MNRKILKVSCDVIWERDLKLKPSFCQPHIYFFPYLKVIPYFLVKFFSPFLRFSIYCYSPILGLQARNKLTHCTYCRPPMSGLQAHKSKLGCVLRHRKRNFPGKRENLRKNGQFCSVRNFFVDKISVFPRIFPFSPS